MNQADQPVVPLNEASLVQRVARKEEAAMEALYQTYADAVLRFVYRRVGENYEDAEEITQEVFLSAISLAETFREPASVFRWLCGIAKIRIVDFYRQQGREKHIPPEKIVAWDEETLRALQEWEGETATEEEVIHRLDVAVLVDLMMAALTEDEREALLLRYVDELSVREVATLMKRTEKAIDNLVTRAKKKAAKASGAEDRKG